jgi:pimeloyl-ACP methyl ester carboxylesterase
MSPTKKNAPITIDDPQVIRRVFYPRRTVPGYATQEGSESVLFPTEGTIKISGRYFPYAPEAPTILFFHGNGEIAADYEDIGYKFGTACEVNFLALDYRGYGESTGSPSNSAMITDARLLFPKVKQYLEMKGILTPIFVMGRSLGSASAIEIALYFEGQLAGIILESAFARVEPLLTLLGVPSPLIARMDVGALSNAVKLRNVHLPLLVIHGEDDSLIPAHQGKELFEASPAVNKKLVIIPQAEHNTILLYDQYFAALKQYISTIKDEKNEK